VRAQQGARIEVERGVLGVRARVTDAGTAPSRTVIQYQLLQAARLSVGRATRLALRAGVGTGTGFLGGWNATGLADGTETWSLYLEQLSLELATKGGLAVSAGGIAPDQGFISELTGFDNDGYLVGVRVAASWPRGILGKLSLTLGDLGDLDRSAVAHRLRRFGRVSHGALMATGRLGSVGVTTQVSFLDGQTALQLGSRWASGRWSVRAEGYARSDSGRGAALAVGVKPFQRLEFQGGVVDVRGSTLNGDRYGPGRHLFASLSLRLGRDYELGGFAQGRSGSSEGLASRFDLVFRANFAAALGLVGR